MSGVTVRCKVRLGRKAATAIKTAAIPRRPQVSRAARMLALAYYIERMIEGGELKDYAEAARSLGLTRARVTQVMNLLNLPAPVQEALLTGEVAVSERRLRRLTTDPESYSEQRNSLDAAASLLTARR